MVRVLVFFIFFFALAILYKIFSLYEIDSFVVDLSLSLIFLRMSFPLTFSNFFGICDNQCPFDGRCIFHLFHKP